MDALSAQDPSRLSVVIASMNGRDYLEPCLQALSRQKGAIQAEIIVADIVGPAVTDFVKNRYPQIILLDFGPEPRRHVFELRGEALSKATAPIIAVTEDHCIPADDWFLSIMAAHQNYPGPAIGGVVENGATGRVVDWAVYLMEYGQFAAGGPAGEVTQLPGPNVSYKADLLHELFDGMVGIDELLLHQRLAAAGYSLWSDPTIQVRHKKHFSTASFWRERFHYSRWFAGSRSTRLSTVQKAVYFLVIPLLPGLIILRLIRRTAPRRQQWGQFARSLPHIALFSLAWALGEAVGLVWGPGDSIYHLC